MEHPWMVTQKVVLVVAFWEDSRTAREGCWQAMGKKGLSQSLFHVKELPILKYIQV